MKARAADAVGFQRRTGVEAEPAEPQQRGADHGHRQAVRRHGFAAEADTLAQQDAPTRPATPALMCTTVPPAKSSAPHCHSRPALAFIRIDVSRRGVGVRAHPEPDHVRDRQVADREPDDREDQHRGELDALHDRSQDQADRDGGERGLEGDEHQLVHRRALAEGRAQRERWRAGAESKVPFRNSRLNPPMNELPSVKASE